MIETLINECMGIDLNSKICSNEGIGLIPEINESPPTQVQTTSEKPTPTTKSKKKSTTKTPREPKIHQKYKQSVNPSKRHRDRLNSELDNLAKLLPFSEDVIARLDKLSILRLSVSFLRNKNFFKVALKERKKEERESTKSNQFSSFFTDALDGFLLVVTIDGEIFFASESVKNYLGYSQSSVLHQPLETFVHDDDKDEIPGFLRGVVNEKVVELDENGEIPAFSEELLGQQREFIVRLKSVLNNGTSDMYKPFKFSGRIQPLNIQPESDKLKYALFAFCTPARTSMSVLEIRMKTTLFCSKNRIDLSFLDMDARGKEYFGYSKKDIFGRSSYVLVHRQDLQHVRCKHTELMSCGKTSIGTFRLMNKNNEWNWIAGYARVLYKNGKPDYMVTTNRILTETEGQAMLKIRDQADYKALENVGLTEPDDPAKALELGFPNRSALKQFMGGSQDDPIPMPLSDFAGFTQNLLNETAVLCKNPNDTPTFEDSTQISMMPYKSNQFGISSSSATMQQTSSKNMSPLQHQSQLSPTLQQHQSYSQQQNSPPLQHQNSSPLQHQNSPPLQHQNSSPLQHQNSPPLQHQNSSPLQHQLSPQQNQQQQKPLPPVIHQQLQPQQHSPVGSVISNHSVHSNTSEQLSPLTGGIPQQAIKIEPDDYSPHMRSHGSVSSVHSNELQSISGSTPNSPPQILGGQQNLSVSLNNGVSSHNSHSTQMTQQFPMSIFDDLPIDFDPTNSTLIQHQQQMPSTVQPRFSFLPPSISNFQQQQQQQQQQSNNITQTRENFLDANYRQQFSSYDQVGPNVTLCAPDYNNMANFFPGHINGFSGPGGNRSRLPGQNNQNNAFFSPHLTDNCMPPTPQHSTADMSWIRQTNGFPQSMTHPNMFINNNSPSSIDTNGSMCTENQYFY